MKTQMYSVLKQLPSSTANNHERYLLVDDINQFVTEILTTMELEEITDSDYSSQGDQNILIQMLKSRLSQNQRCHNTLTQRNDYLPVMISIGVVISIL